MYKEAKACKDYNKKKKIKGGDSEDKDRLQKQKDKI